MVSKPSKMPSRVQIGKTKNASGCGCLLALWVPAGYEKSALSEQFLNATLGSLLVHFRMGAL